MFLIHPWPPPFLFFSTSSISRCPIFRGNIFLPSSYTVYAFFQRKWHKITAPPSLVKACLRSTFYIPSLHPPFLNRAIWRLQNWTVIYRRTVDYRRRLFFTRIIAFPSMYGQLCGYFLRRSGEATERRFFAKHFKLVAITPCGYL